jgi:hypothetical protein
LLDQRIDSLVRERDKYSLAAPAVLVGVGGLGLLLGTYMIGSGFALEGGCSAGSGGCLQRADFLKAYGLLLTGVSGGLFTGGLFWLPHANTAAKSSTFSSSASNGNVERPNGKQPRAPKAWASLECNSGGRCGEGSSRSDKATPCLLSPKGERELAE